MTDIVNIRTYRVPGTKWAVYQFPPDVHRVDRRTRWGNPYSHLSGTAAEHQVATRGEAIAKYREWLAVKLLQQPDFLEPLRGARALACWCAPLPCHAEVLAEYLDQTG